MFVVFSSVGEEGIAFNILENCLLPANCSSSILLISKFIFSPVNASAFSISACNKSFLNCVISALNATIISFSSSKFIY